MTFSENFGTARISITADVDEAQLVRTVRQALERAETAARLTIRADIDTAALTRSASRAATQVRTELTAAFEAVQKSAATNGQQISRSLQGAAQRSAAEFRTALGPQVFRPLVASAEAAATATTTAFRGAAAASNQALTTVTAASAAAGGATRRLATHTNELPPAFQRAARSTSEATDQITEANARFSAFSGTLIRDVGPAADRIRGHFQKITSSIIGLLPNIKSLILGFAAAGAAITYFGLRSFIRFEQSVASITALLGGSQEAVAQFVSRVEDLATRTPFAVDGLIDLSKQLLSIGVNGRDVIPTLQILADAGALFGTSSQGISEGVRALGQIRNSTKPLTQDVRQLTTAFVGFNAEFELAQGAAERGLTVDQLTGAQAYAIIIERLKEFNGLQGAAERQSRTLGGALSNLGDRVSIAAREAFSPLGETLAKLVPVIGDRLEAAFRRLAPPLAELVERYLPIAVDLLEDAADVGVSLAQTFTDLAPTIQFVAGAFAQLAKDATDAVNILTRPLRGAGEDSLMNQLKRDIFELEEGAKTSGPVLAGARSIIDSFVGRFNELATLPIGGAIVRTSDEIYDALSGILSSSRSLSSANSALKSSQEGLADAQARYAELLREGGEEERTQARNSLADATDRLADAQERRNDAQARLNELLAPATQEELAEQQDRVLRAELNLARAEREREAALRALNQTQRASLNLQGQSLDQLRSTLANVRASLAAQRRVNQNQKSEEELREDALDAELNHRDAIRELADERKALSDLEQKGLVETKEITAARRSLRDTERDLNRALAEVGKAREEVRKAESGESGHAKALEQARRGVASAEDAVAQALRGVKEADLEYQRQLALARGDKNADLTYYQQLVGYLDRIGQLRPEAASLINSELFQGLIASLLAQQIAPIVQGINTGLADFYLANNEMGGLITKPTISWVGERYRDELILPLTKPDRVWSLLSQHLPNYPAAQRAATQALERSGPNISISRSNRLPSERPMNAAQAARIIELLEELKAVGGETIDIGGVTVTADTVNGRVIGQQAAKEMIRTLQRQRRKYGRS